MKFLAIDMGNTRSKAALFDSRGLPGTLWQCPTLSLEEHLSTWLECLTPQEPLTVGWISTAASNLEASWPLWQRFHHPPRLEAIKATDQELPIRVGYDTPETLGADRLAAAIGACSYFPGRPVLVIDAGTAITYDLVDASGTYLGGAIAPGLHMRFNALHTFTARLPLVAPTEQAPWLGSSTRDSIRVGAQQGAIREMQGMVRLYRQKMGPNLAVFLTGGDTPVFEKHLKKANFARFHLLLEGIFLTLKHRTSNI